MGQKPKKINKRNLEPRKRFWTGVYRSHVTVFDLDELIIQSHQRVFLASDLFGAQNGRKSGKIERYSDSIAHLGVRGATHVVEALSCR